jgi:hypothetical protein
VSRFVEPVLSRAGSDQSVPVIWRASWPIYLARRRQHDHLSARLSPSKRFQSSSTPPPDKAPILETAASGSCWPASGRLDGELNGARLSMETRTGWPESN